MGNTGCCIAEGGAVTVEDADATKEIAEALKADVIKSNVVLSESPRTETPTTETPTAEAPPPSALVLEEKKEPQAPQEPASTTESNGAKSEPEIPMAGLWSVARGTEANQSGGAGAEEDGPIMKIWKRYTSGPMCQKEKDFFADKANDGTPLFKECAGMSVDEYVKKHEDVFVKMKIHEQKEGWTFKKTEDTVDIYTKADADTGMIYSKGVTTMKTHGKGIRFLLANLLTAEDRPIYDPLCCHGAAVESYLPYYRVVYFQMQTPAILANRDILSLSRIKFEEDGSLIVATESIEHASLPQGGAHAPGFVRAYIMGGYIFHPTADPDEYEVTFALMSDPAGWVPGWLKNMVAWKLQLVVVSFKKWYNENYGPK